MERKFSKITLLSIIVILVIVIIGILTISLNDSLDVREKAFRVESTKIVKSAEEAINKYNNGSITVNNNDSSCKINSKYCFTIAELVNLGIYSNSNSGYSGKIEIYENGDAANYSVYVRKGNEFKIIGGFRRDYTKYGVLSPENWKDEYESCSCE